MAISGPHAAPDDTGGNRVQTRHQRQSNVREGSAPRIGPDQIEILRRLNEEKMVNPPQIPTIQRGGGYRSGFLPLCSARVPKQLMTNEPITSVRTVPPRKAAAQWLQGGWRRQDN